MDKLWRHYAKWNKSARKYKYCISPPKWATESCQIHGDRKWNGGVQGPGRGDNRKLVFNDVRVSIVNDEKVLKVDSDNICTTLWIYLMT